jgi:hypothetical protein
LLSKICFNVIFILKRGKNEKNNNNWPPWKVIIKDMRQFQLVTYPHSAFWAIFMSNLPYTFFGGHDRQTLFVSDEVRSPDNFDTPGNIFYQRHEF